MKSSQFQIPVNGDQPVAMYSLFSFGTSAISFLLLMCLIVFSATKLRRYPTPAMLTCAGLGLMLLVQISSFLIPMLASQMAAASDISWVFVINALVSTVLHIVSVILIVCAVFSQRSPELPPSPTELGRTSTVSENPYQA